MKRLAFLLLCGGLFVAAPSARCEEGPADLAAQIVTHLGSVPQRTEHFHETRELGALTHPLLSSGVLIFRHPDFLEKETLLPQPETLAIEGDTVSVQRGGHVRHILLAQNPALALLATTLRAPLAGNMAALRQAYTVSAQGDMGAWTLTMTPLSEQAHKMVRQVVLSGRNNAVESLKILQANGDRQTLMIDH
ncbi:outer membrane lipoprotein carrier protein LolA [Acetobacter persici]|uniref:LolA-related protein n=1 Tax=Acetobacter persici TaxID=1076596 RepID=UPI001BA8717F|nr:LolA-related protein [Acetobacter persici]MBS1002094.1 outer membrane lipoprotein carrier protein LolA [Acetobacter persici]